MWSHYAKSHTGFCIGYDTEKIKVCAKYFYEITKPGNKVIDYYIINYTRLYPKITPFPDIRDPGAYIAKLKSKSADWKYEKEWRLVINQTEPIDNRIVEIPIDAIVEVYLGLKMLAQHRNVIIDALRKLGYKGKIFKANQDKYNYRLLFTEIPFP